MRHALDTPCILKYLAPYVATVATAIKYSKYRIRQNFRGGKLLQFSQFFSRLQKVSP